MDLSWTNHCLHPVARYHLHRLRLHNWFEVLGLQGVVIRRDRLRQRVLGAALGRGSKPKDLGVNVRAKRYHIEVRG